MYKEKNKREKQETVEIVQLIVEPHGQARRPFYPPSFLPAGLKAGLSAVFLADWRTVGWVYPARLVEPGTL